ncbi:MAG: hypothetical protein HND58_15030 [Planctomycetota bacterium]|nr:MAG: hypothetical protein HND58_15030 [Planctomycetota bacterium]
MQDTHHDLLRDSGMSLEGYAELALIAADLEEENSRRADALWCMGQIARLSEPDLAMGNAGMSYFVMSLKCVPEHIPSCIEIVTLYKERPDGHYDRALAERCIALLLQQHQLIGERDAHLCREHFRVGRDRLSELSRFDELCIHIGSAES